MINVVDSSYPIILTFISAKITFEGIEDDLHIPIS